NRGVADGWWRPGIVAVCGWERELYSRQYAHYFEAHRDIYERLGVPWEKISDSEDEPQYVCRFTEASARAYQLLHIFLHELGHHHDYMTTRSKRDAARGEPYAEAYARKYEAILFDRFAEKFEL